MSNIPSTSTASSNMLTHTNCPWTTFIPSGSAIPPRISPRNCLVFYTITVHSYGSPATHFGIARGRDGGGYTLVSQGFTSDGDAGPLRWKFEVVAIAESIQRAVDKLEQGTTGVSKVIVYTDSKMALEEYQDLLENVTDSDLWYLIAPAVRDAQTLRSRGVSLELRWTPLYSDPSLPCLKGMRLAYKAAVASSESENETQESGSDMMVDAPHVAQPQVSVSRPDWISWSWT